MKLPGWSWLAVGILIAAMSGYVYMFIPRNGEPNMSMAVFFFVGILFIVVGLFKILFKEKEQEPMITSPEHLAKRSPQVMQQQTFQQQKLEQSQAVQPQAHHTNRYSQTHEYHGVHTQRPIQKHMTNHPSHNSHHASHVQSHTHQSPTKTHHTHHTPTHTQHVIACPKCGSRTYSHVNFCHNCGQKLR